MTISGAISSALSALTLNANRLGSAADNVANVSTTAYKATDVRASTVVTPRSSNGVSTLSFTPGGVTSALHSSMDVQGLLRNTGSPTDLAVSGNGFFVVDNRAGGTSFTRSGSFVPDNQGFLVNSAGSRLLGFATDANGNALGTTLAPINVNRLGGSAEATTRIGLRANLPANAAVGGQSSVTVQVRDSLGTSLNLTLNFQKTGTNQATLTISDPVVTATGAASGTTLEGSAGGPAYSVGVQFDSSGLISGFDRDGDGIIDSATPPGVFVVGSSTGADDLDIALDLGAVGDPDGLTQFAGGFQLASIKTNGANFGGAAGVSVSPDGLVSVRFENGQSRSIYRVPVATFTNPNGLAPTGGGDYAPTVQSGPGLIQQAGQGSAGAIQSHSLEQSNVDFGTEFTRVIQAQIAYGFAVKILRTADEMAEELLNVTS